MRLSRVLLVALATFVLNGAWMAAGLVETAEPFGARTSVPLLLGMLLVFPPLGFAGVRLEGASSRLRAAGFGAALGAVGGWIGAQPLLVPVLAIRSQDPVVQSVGAGVHGSTVGVVLLARAVTDSFLWPAGALLLATLLGGALAAIGGACAGPSVGRLAPVWQRPRPHLVAPAVLALAATTVLLVTSTAVDQLSTSIARNNGVPSVLGYVAPTAGEASAMWALMRVLTLVPLTGAIAWLWYGVVRLRAQPGRVVRAARFGSGAVVALLVFVLLMGSAQPIGGVAVVCASGVAILAAWRAPALPPLPPRLYSEFVASALTLAAAVPLSSLAVSITIGMVDGTFAVACIPALFSENGIVAPPDLRSAASTVWVTHLAAFLAGAGAGGLTWLLGPIGPWLRAARAQRAAPQPEAITAPITTTVETK